MSKNYQSNIRDLLGDTSAHETDYPPLDPNEWGFDSETSDMENAVQPKKLFATTSQAVADDEVEMPDISSGEHKILKHPHILRVLETKLDRLHSLQFNSKFSSVFCNSKPKYGSSRKKLETMVVFLVNITI
jgi:hypothetical protein